MQTGERDRGSFFFCGQFLIAAHELGHAAAFSGGPDRHAVGFHHGAVVLLVGLAQLRRHGQLIVEVGQAGIRVEGAGIQDGLGRLLDLRLLLGRGIGPGEVVVDDMITIPIST